MPPTHIIFISLDSQYSQLSPTATQIRVSTQLSTHYASLYPLIVFCWCFSWSKAHSMDIPLHRKHSSTKTDKISALNPISHSCLPVELRVLRFRLFYYFANILIPCAKWQLNIDGRRRIAIRLGSFSRWPYFFIIVFFFYRSIFSINFIVNRLHLFMFIRSMCG